jgi:plastocyanin
MLGCAKQADVAGTASVPQIMPSAAPTAPESSAAVEKMPYIKVIDEPAEAPGETSAVDTIEYLGAQGFSKSKITIATGESITFVNKNPSKANTLKTEVLAFQDQANKKVVNSPQIAYEGAYTHTFDKAGTYKFWSIGYGIFGEVIVE